MIEIDVLQKLTMQAQSWRHMVRTLCLCVIFLVVEAYNVFLFMVVEAYSVFFGISRFLFCCCMQIRSWFDYRNHICMCYVLSCRSL